MEFRKNFKAGVGNKGNAATLEFAGKTYYSNSSIQSATNKGYLKYKGNPDELILLKPKEKRAFLTSAQKSSTPPYREWDRCIDSEAKMMEFMHDNNDRSKTYSAYMVSDFPMCDSCKNVLKQFQQRDKNIELNVIERKSNE